MQPQTIRNLSFAMLGAGALVIVLRIVGPFSDDDDSVASERPTDQQPATTTTVVPTTTTIATATPSDLIVAFVDDYVDAIETEDVDFLVSRLHPAVLDLFDVDLCRTFTEREILALGNYALMGDVSGPETPSIGDRVFAAYTAPTTFMFQGQSFDSPASFAFVDDEIRWFTNCR